MLVNQIRSRIEKKLKEKEITILELCKKIGITQQGYYSIFKNKSLKIILLEKIANVLGVPVGYFFEIEGNKERDDKLISLLIDVVREDSILFLKMSFKREINPDYTPNKEEMSRLLNYKQFSISDLKLLSDNVFMAGVFEELKHFLNKKQ